MAYSELQTPPSAQGIAARAASARPARFSFAIRHSPFAILTGILVITVAGCSAPRRSFLAPLPDAPVWPAPPDVPRVRYLGELRGSEDLLAESQGLLSRVFFGPDRPMQLVTPHAVAVVGEFVAIADPEVRGVHFFQTDAHFFATLQADPKSADTPKSALGVAMCEQPATRLKAKSSKLPALGEGVVMYVVDAEAPGVQVFGEGKNTVITSDGFKRPCAASWSASESTLYVVDAAADCVFLFDSQGVERSRIGQHGAGPGQFSHPSAVACATDGRWAVADSLNFRVQVFDSSNQYIMQIGGKGDAPGNLALPKGVAFDADGNLWVVDAQFENAQAFDRQGRLLMAFGEEGHGPGQFWLPAGMCIDARNRMWIADTYNRRVQVFQVLSEAIEEKTP